MIVYEKNGYVTSKIHDRCNAFLRQQSHDNLQSPETTAMVTIKKRSSALGISSIKKQHILNQ